MKHVPRLAQRIRARRTGVFAAITLTMLAITGGALAWHGFSSASLVSATFSANTVANSQSQTCTAANNDSIQVTEATFTGTATGTLDNNLTGPVTIHAISVYDATTNAGTVSGDLTIGTTFLGHFLTVNAKGALQGMIGGFESGGGQLIGNLSSSFSTTAGFGSASGLATIGSGSATNTAILSTSSCSSASNDNDNDDDQGQGKFSGGFGKFTGPSTFGRKFKGFGNFTAFNSTHHRGGDNQR